MAPKAPERVNCLDVCWRARRARGGPSRYHLRVAPGFVSGLGACNTTDAGEYPRALAANSDDEALSIAQSLMQSLIELRHLPPALSFGEAFATSAPLRNYPRDLTNGKAISSRESSGLKRFLYQPRRLHGGIVSEAQ
jgi:hypothetical protein